MVERARKGYANDRRYQLESCMDYDPAPSLARIKAPLLAINFADDALNPPELGTEHAVAQLPNAKMVLLPASPQTRGHYTTLLAAQWKPHLADFMRQQLQQEENPQRSASPA
jgi:homoserine O-acetyltransferase